MTGKMFSVVTPIVPFVVAILYVEFLVLSLRAEWFLPSIITNCKKNANREDWHFSIIIVNRCQWVCQSRGVSSSAGAVVESSVAVVSAGNAFATVVSTLSVSLS